MSRKIHALLENGLSPKAWDLVLAVKEIADEAQASTYLVGGAVRDLLLGYTSTDLDFVIEGDATALATKVNNKHGGELIVHDRFGTATWFPPEAVFHQSIDFVTARKEIYPKPAALPDVTPSNMKDDLFRRDFTINALAVRLNRAEFGTLVDHYHGESDLEEKVVRILHNQSFADDPTRMWRGVRYEQRLGFQFDLKTLSTLDLGKEAHAALSADRVRHELEKILVETDPAPMLQRLDELGILGLIDQALSYNDAATPLFKFIDQDRYPDTFDQGRMLLFLFAADLKKNEQKRVIQALNLDKESSRNLLWLYDQRDFLNGIQDDEEIPPLKIVNRLKKCSHLLLQILDPFLDDRSAGKGLLERYRTHWQYIQLDLNGDDLIELGVKPGPFLGQVLQRLLQAKLIGSVVTTADEKAFVKQMLSSKD